MQAFGQMSALGGNQVMLFNSFEFLVFFPIVLMIYFIIPKKIHPNIKFFNSTNSHEILPAKKRLS